jgi:hypothetical protein
LRIQRKMKAKKQEDIKPDSFFHCHLVKLSRV